MPTGGHVERAGTGSEDEASIPFSLEGGATRALIRVDNIFHILCAYGAVAAQAAVASLDLVLDQLRMEACLVRVCRPGLVEISFGNRSSADAMTVVETLLDGLSVEPVKLGGLSFHMVLSCTTDVPEGAQALPSYAAAGDDEIWAQQYRQAMLTATAALAAVDEGRLHLHWQPIRSATVPTHVLYSEGLARIVDGDDRLLQPSLFIPALELLGLVRLFDRRVMAAVLDELENFPSAVLGVNISGQSARLDAWWHSLFERLRGAPDVARRLIVEITETVSPDSTVHDFVAELRKLGCRIALDDFGVGFASVRNAMTINPDIIKVDGFFLRRAGLAQRDLAFLEYLTGIAGAIAPIVIVEGVEVEQQSRVAADLQRRFASQTDCWQQGYYLGRASARRNWRYRQSGDETVQVVPLRELIDIKHDFRGEGSAGLGRA